MKNIWDKKRYFSILNYITDNERYKALFFVNILICLYAVFGLASGVGNYIDAIYVVFTFPMFQILFLISLFFLTMQVCLVFFDYLDAYQIRLRNKKNCMRELIYLVILSDVIYIIQFLILFLAFLNLTNYGMYKIHQWAEYPVNNLIYVTFYMVRFILFSILCSVIFSLFYNPRHFGKIILFIIVFLSGFILLNGVQYHFILLILPWTSFLNITYPNFTIELVSSLCYLCFLFISAVAIYLYKYRKRGV